MECHKAGKVMSKALEIMKLFEERKTVYHVTLLKNLPDIAKNGLQAGRKINIGGTAVSFNRKDSKGRHRLFWTEFSGVRFWYDKAEEFAHAEFDNFKAKRAVPVVLRTTLDSTFLNKDERGSSDSGYDAYFMTDGTVKPNKLKVFDGSSWVSPSKFKDIDSNIEDTALDYFEEDGGYWDFKSSQGLRPKSK